MDEALFIVNPTSARGTTLRTWSRAQRKLTERGIRFREHITSRAGEAASLARAAISDGARRVIAVGGDGTLSEVVDGYLGGMGVPINSEAAIGLLPSGTGSDFRRSLGLRGQADFIEAIGDDRSRLIDAVHAEFTDENGGPVSRCLINIASFGLGGDVSGFVNKWRETLPGWVGGRARFILAAVRALERYKNVPTSVRLDENRDFRIETNLIVVANGKFAGGGMMLAPHARLDDGLLDVILTDGATRLDVIKQLPRIQRGGHLNHPKVTEMRARQVFISPGEPLAMDIDGEMAGFTPARLTVLPSVVRFIF